MPASHDQRGESIFMVACSLGLNELVKRMAEDSDARDLMRKDVKIERKVSSVDM